MRQNASLLVHIGPLREESETLLEQVSQPTLLASLTAPTAARQKTLQEVLPALYLAELPVTSSGGEVDCYLYGLQDFNSLAPASELAQLYPGLGQARQKSLETQTLPQALEQAGLGEAKITHLVIEQPEMGLDLLQAFSHSGLLEQLIHLWVRTSPLRLYESMATEAELAEWCQQHGFESVEVEADDPDFYIQRFKRNPLYSQLQSSQAQLSTAQSNLEARNAELKKLKQAQNKLTQQLEASQQQQKESEETHKQTQQKLADTHTWFMSRKQQAEELTEKLKTTEEELEKYKSDFAARKKQHEEAESQLIEIQQLLKDKDATIKQLNEQLETFQHNGERFSQLESKLDALFGEQRTYIQQTTNALGQHVTRSARQQRDEQALTHYLQHGQRPLSTQLAPGYAMALLEHYDTYHHDVLVVFGSTEITELLAQSIINARSDQPRLENGQRKPVDNDVTLSNVDLPQAIVSVEHQKKASEALKQRLSHQRLSQAVNVVYAPWVECQAQNGNGQPTLFYAAEPTLQRLNQWLPEDARVLVIVGECLINAGHSRDVVLALLLQQLPTQRLDIVLEGNNHPQESNLKESWDKLLETRQRPGQWLTLPNTHSLRVEG